MKSLYITFFLFFSVLAYSQECSKFLDFVVPQNNNYEEEVFTHLEYPSLNASCSVTHFGVDAWTNDIYSTPVISHAYGIVEQSGLSSSSSIGYYSLIRYPNCSESGENKYVLILHYSGSPIAQGLSVYCGDTIGYTGSSNGVDHVHLEVRDFNEINNSSVLGCSGSPNIYGAGDYSLDPVVEEYDDPCNPPRGFWTEINQQTDLVIGENTQYLQIRIPQSGTMNFSGITKSAIDFLRINTKERNVLDFENIQNQELRFKIDVSEFANSTEHKTIPLGFTLKLNDRWYNYTAKVNVVGEFSDVQYSMINLFSSEIQEAIDLGLFKGTPDGNFLPLNTLTKGQAAKVIVTTAFKLGLITVQDYTSGPFYGDMNSSNEFYPFVFTLEHYLSLNNVSIDLDVPEIASTNNFNPNAPISIGLFGSWLKHLLVLTENGEGIDRDSDIAIPNNGNNTMYNALNVIKNVFIKDKEGILESVLNDLGSPELTITRSMAAKALVNGYKVRFNELNENEALFRPSSSPVNPFEDYSIIGDKQEILQSATPEDPPSYTNLNITMTSNQDSIILGPENFLDSNGIPFNFYWVSNDGVLNALTEFKNKVSWKPPISNNVATYRIDLYINHVSGSWGQATINITVYPNDNIPEATLIDLSASLSQTSADPLEVITVSGTATYDNGLPVEVSTIFIETGNYTYAAETDENGGFDKAVPAPEVTSNIQVSIDDGVFSDNITLPISITTPPNSSSWDHHYSDHFRYVNGTPDYQSDKVGSDWSRVYTWTEFDNISSQVKVKIEYYKPDGNFLFEVESAWSPQGDDVFAYYSYMNVDDETISDHQGTWNTKIYAKSPSQTWQFVKSMPFHLSHQFVENKICEDVDFTNCSAGTSICPVINEKNVFTQDDAQVTVYSHNRDIGNGLDLKAEFIEPNGDLYEVIYDNIPHPGFGSQAWYPHWYQAFHQPIDGYPMEDKTGKWEVKCYSEDPFGNWDLEYEDFFFLFESENVNPDTDVVKTSGNYEGDDIYLSISASDNTYLNSTTVYWRVNGGSWTSVGWSNINSGSFGNSNFLVDYPFVEGDILEYRTEALDNSGNFGGSQLKSFTIKDNDTEAPEITNFTVVEIGGDGDGMVQDNETFNISFNVSDVSGIQSVQTIIDGVTVSLNSDYEVTLSHYSPGTHFVTVVATDDDNSPETRTKYFSFEICDEIAYLDNDGDGYGDPNTYYYDCEIPNGYVSNGLDCSDEFFGVNSTILNPWKDIPPPLLEDWLQFGYSVAENDFGYFCSTSGEDNNSGNGSGSIYMFNRFGQLLQRIQPQVEYSSLYGFGRDIVGSGDLLIAGSWEGSPNSINEGVVYVYKYGLDSMEFHQRIKPSSVDQDDNFGYKVSIDSTTLVISALKEESNNSLETGAVYVYELQSDSFEFVTKLVPSDELENGQFGRDVLIKDDLIIVKNVSGDRYIYEYQNNQWVEIQKLPLGYQAIQIDIFENQFVVGKYSTFEIYEQDSNTGLFVHLQTVNKPSNEYTYLGEFVFFEEEKIYITCRSGPTWYGEGKTLLLKYKKNNQGIYSYVESFVLCDETPTTGIDDLKLGTHHIICGYPSFHSDEHNYLGAFSLTEYRKVPVNIRVLLKQFYQEELGLMNDSLRTNELIPDSEPYTALGEENLNGGFETISSTEVFEIEGNDAIVDWVHVKMYSQDSILIGTRNGLIQRDGDIVDVDGVSPLMFSINDDQIYEKEVFFSIKHYNHFTFSPTDIGYLDGCHNSYNYTDSLICSCNYVLNTKDIGEGSLRYALECGDFENVYFSDAVANDTIVITNPFWFDIDQNKILDTEGRNVTIHKTQGFYLFSLDIGKQLTLKDMNIYLPYSNWVSNKSTFINTSGSLVLDNVVVKVLPTEDDIKIYAPGILSTRNAVKFEKIE